MAIIHAKYEYIKYIKVVYVSLLTMLGLQQLCALVEHLEEELMPGQGAQDTESCLTVRSIATEPKRPLGLQVCQNEGEVLYLGDVEGAREGELRD